jgi:hypothetical protein
MSKQELFVQQSVLQQIWRTKSLTECDGTTDLLGATKTRIFVEPSSVNLEHDPRLFESHSM